MNIKERSVKKIADKLIKVVPNKLYGDYELKQALYGAIERIVDKELGEMDDQLLQEISMIILERIDFEGR